MKILIWGEVKAGGPYDVFRRLDYGNIYKELFESYCANTTNIGNKVWIQGIISALSTFDNQLYFYNPNEPWEIINEKYDSIVYSAANMFSITYKNLLHEVASIFRNSKIPVYVISIGAQANSYSDLRMLVSSIGKETIEFVDSIYTTGGEIACRGYFTKEFLDNVCDNSAVVTGCPSLYQNGRELKIIKDEDFKKPIFNGMLINNKELFTRYPTGIFIDQDVWMQEVYNFGFYEQSSVKCYIDLIEKNGFENTSLFLNGRIKLFYDISDWKDFIEKGKFDFSVGTRIHGNIMSLLSGIPSCVLSCDSRTREMAEFYEIPTVPYKSEEIDVQKLYDKLDFSAFNRNFTKKYDDFESFLVRNKLVKSINDKNIFWKKERPILCDESQDKINKIKKIDKFLTSTEKKVVYRVARKLSKNNMLLQSIETKEQY